MPRFAAGPQLPPLAPRRAIGITPLGRCDADRPHARSTHRPSVRRQAESTSSAPPQKRPSPSHCLCCNVFRVVRDSLGWIGHDDRVVVAKTANAIDVDAGFSRENLVLQQRPLVESCVVWKLVARQSYTVTSPVNDVLTVSGALENRQGSAGEP